MSKDDLKILKLLKVNTRDSNALKEINTQINKLKKDGFEELSIEIKSKLDANLKNSGFSKRTFDKIKQVQDLPDWVVLDLLNSTGTLKGSGYDKRIKNAKN